MKKLINDVETVLAESLDGFAAAHADIVTLGAERLFVRRRQTKAATKASTIPLTLPPTKMWVAPPRIAPTIP